MFLVLYLIRLCCILFMFHRWLLVLVAVDVPGVISDYAVVCVVNVSLVSYLTVLYFVYVPRLATLWFVL